MAASVMSSNIEKALNDAPVTSNFQNVIFTATTTSSNTMHEIQSKQSSATHLHTLLAQVLSSNIITIKSASESSSSKSLPLSSISKVNFAETLINRGAIKT